MSNDVTKTQSCICCFQAWKASQALSCYLSDISVLTVLPVQWKLADVGNGKRFVHSLENRVGPPPC